MSDFHQVIEAVWRIESTRLIAGIAPVTRDIGIAEELTQDALVAALEQWPETGVPDNPAGWLMAAAKRRALDHLRRGRILERKLGEIARDLAFAQQRLADALDHSLDQVIDDDVLRLVFTACHPILPVEGRVALTLRLIGGRVCPILKRTSHAGATLVSAAGTDLQKENSSWPSVRPKSTRNWCHGVDRPPTAKASRII